MDDLFNFLTEDMENFYNAVKLLSNSVNRSGIDWNDEKYTELAGKIRSIASSSSLLLKAGEESALALQNFARIAQED